MSQSARRHPYAQFFAYARPECGVGMFSYNGYRGRRVVAVISGIYKVAWAPPGLRSSLSQYIYIIPYFSFSTHLLTSVEKKYEAKMPSEIVKCLGCGYLYSSTQPECPWKSVHKTKETTKPTTGMEAISSKLRHSVLSLNKYPRKANHQDWYLGTQGLAITLHGDEW